jgi:hypothetical protein
VEGRYAKGLFVEFSHGVAPAQRDTFERWYSKVHMPDIQGTGWTHHGSLYRLSVTASDARLAEYVAIYETDRWDMESLLDELRLRISASPGETTVIASLFRLCGPSVRPEDSPFVTARTLTATLRGVHVVVTTCIDPSREQRFNSRYNRKVVPAEMDAAPFTAAYRYAEGSRDEKGHRRFLALYETEQLDTPALQWGAVKLPPDGRDFSFPGAEWQESGVYELIARS